MFDLTAQSKKECDMTKEQIEQIAKQNMEKIYLYCVRKLGNMTEAEDVASDIILELLRSYPRIQNDDAVYGYLWRVADNLCKNHWRKYQKYDHDEIPEDYPGIYMVTPEDSFVHKQELGLLRRELSLLTSACRKVMVEHYLKNKSCEEIARSMNMSVTNVKQYLFEGRKKVRKGMEMKREYGVYSYAPEKFTMNFWGDRSAGYWELFQKKLPGNIMLAVYDSPKTMEELSMELGVAVPWLEDEVEPLLQFDLLKKKGTKYYSNIVIYNNHWVEKIHEKAREELGGHLEEIKSMLEKGIPLLEQTDYSYHMDDLNSRKWFLLTLIFWEAMGKAEGFMKTKLTFPLLANGSKGYVMGQRGEVPYNMNGIYGMYSLKKGYLRILNYKQLSERILNPFERGCADVLAACEERLEDTENIEALPDLLKSGFVRIENGRLHPCYAEISEADYQKLKEELADEIEAVARIAGKHRDMAGAELKKLTPDYLSGACEIGSIVSMWSFLENIVPVILEDGYLTKGKDGQNLTTFYFRR